MVAVCFPFISYKFQHPPSSLRTVVSIHINGVQDIRSVFHRLFFSCVNMADFEQRTVIIFLSKRNKTNVKIENELFEVCGDAAYEKSTVQKWTKRFHEVRDSLWDNDRVGRPSTSLTDEKVEEVCELIWSVREIAEEFHIILTEKWQKENDAKLHLPIFNVVTHSGWNIGDTASMPVANISKLAISYIIIIFWM